MLCQAHSATLTNLDNVSKIITNQTAHTNEYRFSAMAKKGSPETATLGTGVGAMDSILEHASSLDNMDTKQPAPNDESCSNDVKSTHAQTMNIYNGI